MNRPAKGSLAHNYDVHTFTGSVETEEQLRLFLSNVASVDHGIPRQLFTNSYMWQVMTEGRNKKGQCYEGSQALDDTGGFFDVKDDGLVYLTEKARACIRVGVRVYSSELEKLAVGFDLSYSAVLSMGGTPVIHSMENLTKYQVADLNKVIEILYPIYRQMYPSYMKHALDPPSGELLTSFILDFEQQCKSITAFKVVSKADLNFAHNYLECEALYNRIMYTGKFTFSCYDNRLIERSLAIGTV